MIKAIQANDFDKLLEFLNQFVEAKPIEPDEYGFTRTIEFTIYDQVFRITWYMNESKVAIGTHKRPPQYNFRFIEFDKCFPLIDGNNNLSFFYHADDSGNRPYDCFRIPLPLKTVQP